MGRWLPKASGLESDIAIGGLVHQTRPDLDPVANPIKRIQQWIDDSFSPILENIGRASCAVKNTLRQ